MKGSNVDEVDVIPTRPQPAGMSAWPATDVEDRGGRRRQKACQQLARAFAIELTGALMQPAGLGAGGVVCGDRFRRWGMYHTRSTVMPYWAIFLRKLFRATPRIRALCTWFPAAYRSTSRNK